MKLYEANEVLGQFEQHKGGYTYLTVPAEVVNTFKDKRQTRLICTINNTFSFQCGLNHLGDGNFFIILNRKNLKAVGKAPGDTV